MIILLPGIPFQLHPFLSFLPSMGVPHFTSFTILFPRKERKKPSITASLFQGDPPLMSMAQLIVEVVDVNENNFAPVFDDFVARGWVKENQDVTRVMQVRFEQHHELVAVVAVAAVVA